MKLAPVIMVIACTMMTALAELIWKSGSQGIVDLNSFISSPYVIIGFILYGLGAILMILALSKGELSILYPMLSLTFIWGLIFSVIFLSEPLNITKVAGFAVVVLGVVILGRAGW